MKDYYLCFAVCMYLRVSFFDVIALSANASVFFPSNVYKLNESKRIHAKHSKGLFNQKFLILKKKYRQNKNS